MMDTNTTRSTAQSGRAKESGLGEPGAGSWKPEHRAPSMLGTGDHRGRGHRGDCSDRFTGDCKAADRGPPQPLTPTQHSARCRPRSAQARQQPRGQQKVAVPSLAGGQACSNE